MNDPLFDQLLGLSSNGRGGRGRDLGAFAPSAGSILPALHVNCDVVEKPDRYSIIAGGLV
jgi:hypothetical protein